MSAVPGHPVGSCLASDQRAQPHWAAGHGVTVLAWGRHLAPAWEVKKGVCCFHPCNVVLAKSVVYVYSRRRGNTIQRGGLARSQKTFCFPGFLTEVQWLCTSCFSTMCFTYVWPSNIFTYYYFILFLTTFSIGKFFLYIFCKNPESAKKKQMHDTY